MSNLGVLPLGKLLILGYNTGILNRKVDRRDALTSGGLGNCVGGAITMVNHIPDASSVKVCPNCKQTKSIALFGVRKSGRDAGQTRTWCKACEGAYKRSRREHYSELEASRRAENRDEFNAYMARYSAKRKDRVAAMNAVNNAIRAGRLAKASENICAICGTATAQHYHHNQGYTPEYRMSVIPVCIACHEREHHTNG